MDGEATSKFVTQGNISDEIQQDTLPSESCAQASPEAHDSKANGGSAALTEQFESTLEDFLRSGSTSPPPLENDAAASEKSDPITSVFDLLSEETRSYLRQYRDRKEHESWQEPPQITEKRVRMREPLAEEPLPRPASDEADDALNNYMLTMQQFIGRTYGSVNGRPAPPLVGRKRESAPTFKDKFGYEPIDHVARTLDPSVRRWLIGLRLPNLPKYLELFEANEVDRESLKLLTEGQLRRMGINKLGPLNKMLHSIRVLRNCEPPRMPPPPPPPSVAKTTEESARRQEGFLSSRSVPSSARGPERTKATPRRAQSARSHASPRKDHCLLRLFEAHDGGIGEKQRRLKKVSSLPSARSAVSGVELVQKASKEIERAAQKYHTKIELDAQRREMEEKKMRQLQEKREKFAADYRKRQMLHRDEENGRTPRTDGPKSVSAPTTPRTPRKKKLESKSKENYSDLHAVETQMGLDAQKPNLVCEDQLNDLELQIQNLVDVQDLRQADSHSLISCIDQLQHKLQAIQALVAQQKALAHPKPQPKIKRSPQRTEKPPPPAVTPRSSDLPGQDLAQTDLKFTERDYLGEGFFTQVFRGRYRKREVAVKRLKTPLTTEEKIRLANEVSTLMELEHENVNRILGCFVRMKFPLLVIEFGRGGSLAQLLRRPEPLDHCAFFQIAEDVCSGLAYLHTGSPLSPRPHLRLTSHNVLLDWSLRARLSDVGLSRLRHECARVMREAGAARAEWSQLAWMAPEVLGGEEAGPPADVYSFGVLLWEMLMRQTPYEGLTTFQMMERIRDGPVLSIPDACPVGLRSLIRRCWQLRRGDRPSIQEALLAVSRLKVPVSWQTVLQSAGLPPNSLREIAFFRRLVAEVLDMPAAPPEEEHSKRQLPPAGPCGVLSSPLPDLDLSPVTKIEELAQKVAAFIQQKSEDTPFGSRSSPLTAELSARGAMWNRLERN